MTTTDPLTLAGLTEREVHTSERDGAPTKVAVVRRDYPTDRADLWHALTDPERIPRWFLPVTGSTEPGGRFQVEGNASGTVQRCDPPEAYALTWEYGPMVSWLEVRLVEHGDRTRLELRHEAPVDPDMWRQFGPGAVGIGWDLALTVGLAAHVETGEAVDPEEGAAFALTDAGKEVVRHCAEAWRAAAVAGGEDEATMAEATEAVVAFYTVPPDAEPGQ